jgi:aromatic-L-amino-acid decarboxylase
MTPEEFRQAAHEAVDWMADYLADIRGYRVFPQMQPGDLIRQLPAAGPEQGEPWERILEDFIRRIVPATTHWNHPRFFAYFAISASGPGILGEMLAAALNVNGMLWRTSPAATELEQVALGWLRDWLGLPAAFFGVIHDTASTGVMHALAAAREQAAPGARRRGVAPGLVLYVSEHAHNSIEKAAVTLGLGSDFVRKIPTDAAFAMDVAALEEAIARDRAAGLRPFAVAATIGTTSFTGVDPVAAIAAITRREGLWLHVDAAYAGPCALLDEMRPHFAGWELADSVIVNPHKWLFTPVDASLLYIRRPELLREAFAVDTPAYLRAPEPDQTLNYSEYGLPLGRRFRSLKLWFVLRACGREGIRAILRDHLRWAARLADRIRAHPDFELIAEPRFSLVCFRLRGSDEANHRLVDRVNATGKLFVSGTQYRDRYVIRLAVGNVATTEADVDLAWETFLAASRSGNRD